MTRKTAIRYGVAGVAGVAMLGAIAWLVIRGEPAAPSASFGVAPPAAPSTVVAPVAVRKPAPTRNTVPAADDVDTIDGQLVDATTLHGIAGAALTFTGADGERTFTASSDGSFEISPNDTPATLTTAWAPGYLPYAPDGPRSVHVSLRRGRGVHGVKLLLSPSIEYRGLVVDGHGAPVVGARVHLARTPADDPMSEPPEWHTGSDGRFAFHGVEGALLEANAGGAVGYAAVDRGVIATHSLRIELGHPRPFDATITGRVVDGHGAAVGGATIHAHFATYSDAADFAFTTSADDGSFTLRGIDHASYDVAADAPDHVRATLGGVAGGARNVTFTLDDGRMLAGHVVDARGAPVARFTLVVRRAKQRGVVAQQAIVDAQGRFELRVAPGDYELLASAHGSGRGTPALATASDRDVKVVYSAGGSVRGVVVSSEDHAPIPYAFVRADLDRGPPLLAGDQGVTTHADGTFELGELSAGPLALRADTLDYNTAIVPVADLSDGAVLGPITIELSRREAGRRRGTDLVGIGVNLQVENDGLRVMRVLPDGPGAAAGVRPGELIVAVDGQLLSGMDAESAVSMIRGPVGSAVTLTLKLDGQERRLTLERRVVHT